jgi:hypothetical protein
MAPKRPNNTRAGRKTLTVSKTNLMINDNIPCSLSEGNRPWAGQFLPSSQCQLLTETTRNSQGPVLLLESLPSPQSGPHHLCSMNHVNRFLS